MHDIVFILGPNEERMFAHKLFLISSSPVFHNILSQDVGTILNIKINQISKNTMMEICRFAYTENVNLTLNNMFDVLHAATKFEMRFLVEKIIDFASKQLNENSVFKILENNQQLHNWQINKKCFEFIEKNHQKCFKSKNWLKVTQDLMRLILQNCKIPEEHLKDALTNWSKSQGDGVEVLNEMMALVSLDKGESETESVVSETTGKVRRQRRYGRHTKVFTRTPQPNDQNSGKEIQKPKKNQPQGQNIMPKVSGLFLLIGGPRGMRNFKYANLDLIAVNQNVFIEAVEFIYNLVATDTEFELQIYIVNNTKRTQVYNEKVKITESLKKHELKGKKCMIPAGKKAWIKIEFSSQKLRPTFSDYFISPLSEKDLQISKDPNVNSYAQIIELVYYGK